MLQKVLIVNRGDIALRIIRACRELGISTVVAHSTVDAESMAVRLADESVCIGPPRPAESYLNMPSVMMAARLTDADAVHPGVGFLSENAEFAEMVTAHDLVFVGPSAQHIRQMGDKALAKSTAKALGIPVVPGSDGVVDTAEEAQDVADGIGYPVLIKAVAGGGGRGMRVVESHDDLPQAFAACRHEARTAFGSDAVYIEKYLDNPRHVEIQLFGDGKGGAVHYFERDCSVQRRHQKLIEEATAPGIPDAQRLAICEVARKAVAELQYAGPGTIEFLYLDGAFYFIEMNTRLQVEHPISEMLCGVDLVHEQLRVASGYGMSRTQADIVPQGHAIECRINAETSEGFLPSPGLITAVHAPGGPGVRFDGHIFSGYKVSPYYDSLLAKLIVHAPTRALAITRMQRALEEFHLEGVASLAPFHQRVMANKDFQDGGVSINWLQKQLDAGTL
ncbi:MAG: acetyl-CoA carboxylase biotin carboxylase subunit [Alphaproteobacteria bacterium]|nr:acetyl-CoA carboxylase biotin carboxylase subunit [Alphaproteobacteria bacterium]